MVSENLVRHPLNGSTEVWVHLHNTLGTLTSIVADSCGVFWADRDISGLTSFVPTVLTTAVSSPKRIATDDGYVYWADTSFIGRVPK